MSLFAASLPALDMVVDWVEALGVETSVIYASGGGGKTQGNCGLGNTGCGGGGCEGRLTTDNGLTMGTVGARAGGGV